MRTALTIAGSDSGGGAGLQADLKTFAAHAVFGTTAVTAITAQNTMGVIEILALSPSLVEAQVGAVLDDLGAEAVKTGMLATGDIVERSEDSLTVNIGAGNLTVQMSTVVRIEESTSPLQEYQARAKSIPADDTEAWRELARWVRRQGLSSQAKEAYSQVLAILPDDQEANSALGRVQLDGRWVSEQESYRARGFVEFEAEWMTPGERQAILAERQATKEADRQLIQTQIQATEAEQERERKAAESENVRRDGLPQLGDPIFWGWGSGPTNWSTRTRPQPINPANSPTGGSQ